MDRLALPMERLGDCYDVVVVGSGYGGGIAASRLARAGKRVCVLERGRERQPGEYPDTALEATLQLQVNHNEGHTGSPLGMFDFHVHPGMSALVGCGLGGTSLINANVAVEPDPRVFAQDDWPAALRDRTALDPFYSRARSMLQPSPYPAGSGDYSPLPKTIALATSAEVLPSDGRGNGFTRPPIDVNFVVDGPNHVDTLQRRCNNCGDCVTGCNVRAKNTVLMNYLPDARNFGAEIFVECAVHHVEPDGPGWLVFYDWLGAGSGEPRERAVVRADVVVLAAGTLGSTELLLRSRATVPMSDALGKRFSGNGDVLAFANRSARRIDGVGYGHHRPNPDRPVGPCITGLVDRRSLADVNDSWIIEDGTIPGALRDLTAVALALDTASPADAPADGSEPPNTRAVDRAQTYLVMSHDGSAGKLVLDGDRVCVDWPAAGNHQIFTEIAADLHTCASAIGGEYLADPISAPRFGSNLLTVHPLGGCVLADHAGNGVVSDRGKVFRGTAGTEVYESLYVADGSVIPTSLGVNPLLTISAVAERIVALLAEERGWTIDFDARSRRPPDWPDAKPGIAYTEQMAGYWSADPKLNYADALHAGREADSALSFTATIESDDVATMLSDSAHEARLVGMVTCPALSPDPLIVHAGRFKLFVDDPAWAGARQMVYELPMTAPDGTRYVLHGVKDMPEASAVHLWSATTTLYVDLFAADGTTAIGRGILRLSLPHFLHMLRTTKITNEPDATRRAEWVARFGRSFAGGLWDIYGGPLAGATHLQWEPTARDRRQLEVGEPEEHPVRTADGKDILLTRFRDRERTSWKGPVILVHGLGVSSKIFAIDTIQPNLLEFLYGAGYDCWLLDYRCSTALPTAALPANGDDVASFDLPAAVDHVLGSTRSNSVQLVVHCYGATTFTMAMLGGHVDPVKIRSCVISQISADVRVPWLTKMKSWTRVADVLHAVGLRVLTSNAVRTESTALQAFDRLLAAPYAVLVSQGGRCDNPVCHRIAFLYGSLHSHAQLNSATHNALHEMFGTASTEQFQHLSTMVRHRRVVRFDGENSYYTEANLAQMGVPIGFIHGADNRCYLPSSTARTESRLADANGAALYTREVVPGYTHLDCIYGEHASEDVYPLILGHLDAHPATPVPGP